MEDVRDRLAEIYCFDRFILDLHRGILLNTGGEEISLRPKSFALLRTLVENAGRLLDRDALMAAVWPGVFVTDESVAQCVKDVRRALGDEGQRLIRTVVKRGYVLSAEVTSRKAEGNRIQPVQAAAASPAAPASEREGVRPAAPGVAMPSVAERRQLTLLFCDLTGSAALSAKLDPEDLQSVIKDYHRAASAAVTAQGGYVARLLGDGMVAYFGWPQAREDNAERAVRAGLAVIAAVSRLEVPQAGPLAARVGIATGSVVVGEVLGEGEARELGAAPNLAARLRDAVGPNMAAADALTRRLTGVLFKWADLGEVALRGLPDSIQAWRALGPSDMENRFEALRGAAAQLPLIGREEELELLRRRWRQACAGQGRTVLLGGEPGIGKSRLTAALRDAVAGDVHEEVMLFCSPQHTNSSLRPVIAELERAADLAVGDAPEARLAALEALFTPLVSPAEDVALIAELLSVSTLGRWPALDLSPQARRLRLLEALLRRIRSLAARRPVLAVVEDAHWLDPTTRELLDLLVAETANLALLIVVTYRPEFDPGGWLGLPHVTLLHLNRFGRAEHDALLRQVAGGKALPAEVEVEVLARTDGVPLFVEEVGRAVLESGLLREEADRWVVDGALPRLAVPASLHASLMARLDRLGPAAKEVAQAGAAIGREFGYGVLAATIELSAPQLHEALDRLSHAGLVFARGTPPEASYLFKHALVQDIAYGGLLRGRRQWLHGRIVAVLEGRFPEVVQAQPALLAQHCAAAGLVEKSVAYWGRAGRRSADRSAMAEAAAQFKKGLNQLRLLPDNPERQRQELEFCSALGAVLRGLKGTAAPATGHAFTRARELWEQLGFPPEYLYVGYLQSRYHVFRGELGLALRQDEELLRLSRRQNDPIGLILSHTTAGLNLMSAGKFASSRSHLEEAVALCDPAFHRPLIHQAGVHPYGSALPWLGIVLFCLGFPDQALARARTAAIEAGRLAHPPTLASGLTGIARLMALVGDNAALDEYATQILAIAAEQDFPLWQALGTFLRGWVKVENGDVAEGIALMRSGWAACRATGTEGNMVAFIALLARASDTAGQFDEAVSWVNEALRVAERTGELWLAAELYRHKGQLLFRQGRSDAAEELYRKALSVAEEQEARLWELRAAMSLARLRRDQGRRGEARNLLGPIYNWFTEGFDVSDLKDAKSLLDELA